MTTAAKKYITPDELVERWGGALKKGTLANQRCKGEGPPFVKRGSKVLYPLAELEAWEAANDNIKQPSAEEVKDLPPELRAQLSKGLKKT